MADATTIKGIAPQAEGRITSEPVNGTMEYLKDGKVIDFEDGFRMSVGQEQVGQAIRSSFVHISPAEWARIFGKKE